MNRTGLRNLMLLVGLAMPATASPAADALQLRTEPWRSDFEVLSQNRDRLRYAGTLRLFTPAPLESQRGGWSSLVNFGPNVGFQATSDRNGHWLTFDVALNEGNLVGAQYLDHGQIKGPDGQGLDDIESMIIIGELILAGLDGSADLYQLDRHRTRAYPRFTLPDFAPGRNDGIEALAFRSPHGPLLPIAEKSGSDPHHRQAWWLIPDQATTAFELPLALTASPVGATHLANGDVVLLHRHYERGVTTIGLSHYPADELSTSDLPQPQSLIEMRSSVLTQALDNFEGIAAFQRDGRQYLLLISDDNVDWQRPGAQNTLLMLFEWLH
ncbi:esterase-like activity of phytase family protein [Marinobacter hydrocarbonoclasticus]|nr:esterase-like activity of phytase family protein [Marinobacter nauticus]